MDKDTPRGRSSWPSSNTVPYSPPSSTCTWGFYFISHCHPHFKYRHKCLLLEIPKYHRPEEKRQRPITAHGQLLLHTMFSPVLWFWAFAHATHCLPQVLFLPFLLCNPLLISLIISYIFSLFLQPFWISSHPCRVDHSLLCALTTLWINYHYCIFNTGLSLFTYMSASST